MGSESSKNPAHADILAAVKDGKIAEGDLDRAVIDILRVVAKSNRRL